MPFSTNSTSNIPGTSNDVLLNECEAECNDRYFRIVTECQLRFEEDHLNGLSEPEARERLTAGLSAAEFSLDQCIGGCSQKYIGRDTEVVTPPPTTAVFFDLEGPLSPQDNLFEICRALLGDSIDLFSIIDTYDDELASSGSTTYEPGNTVALMLPLLVRRGLTAATIAEVSKRTTQLQPGAKAVMDALAGVHIPVHIVTTSLAPHAFRVARAVGVDLERVYATEITDAQLQLMAPASSYPVIDAFEADLLAHLSNSGATKAISPWLSDMITEFYSVTLPRASGQDPLTLVQPRGGRRKVRAVERALMMLEAEPSTALFVGDSITDIAVMDFVNSSAGLSVAFNGSLFALKHARVGLAEDTLEAVLPIIESWGSGGIVLVRKRLKERQTIPGAHWLPEARKSADDFAAIAATHLDARRRMRTDVAELS